jgi:DNA-binding transcriptional MerR regulator
MRSVRFLIALIVSDKAKVMTARDSSERTLPPRASGSRLPEAPEPYRYSIADLERETEISARTIRYYVSEGMLPPAYGRGPTATYDLGHLMRLQMIGQLKREGLSLGEIRTRLETMTDDEIAGLLRIQTRPPEDRWRRVTLHPNLELHVREPGGEPDYRLEEAVDLLIKLAQPVIDQLQERSK